MEVAFKDIEMSLGVGLVDCMQSIHICLNKTNVKREPFNVKRDLNDINRRLKIVSTEKSKRSN